MSFRSSVGGAPARYSGGHGLDIPVGSVSFRRLL